MLLFSHKIMNLQLFLTIILSAYSYYFMDKVLKNTPNDVELTKSEKTQVIVLLLLNTLISFLIFSFGWKSKLPSKSKQVNKYLRNILLILVGLGVLGILLAIFFVAINTATHISN